LITKGLFPYLTSCRTTCVLPLWVSGLRYFSSNREGTTGSQLSRFARRQTSRFPVRNAQAFPDAPKKIRARIS